uniref:Uncharacterized protein n=1 Tax=Timema douglasi TaxID=61478 RepID=A0A7R8VMC0_TIMDO|nr:unnamed protein product [Timema douglasi]
MAAGKGNTVLHKYCETRWLERHDVVSLFHECFECIIEVLETIMSNEAEANGNATSLHTCLSQALGFCNISKRVIESFTAFDSLYEQSAIPDLLQNDFPIDEPRTPTRNVPRVTIAHGYVTGNEVDLIELVQDRYKWDTVVISSANISRVPNAIEYRLLVISTPLFRPPYSACIQISLNLPLPTLFHHSKVNPVTPGVWDSTNSVVALNTILSHFSVIHSRSPSQEELIKSSFSTLLDDRRDACRALKALSRKYRIEVGAQGMGALKHVLETDHADSEIVGYTLDTLCNITAPETFEEEEHPSLGPTLTGVSQQFTEIFIKQPDNVALVLGFLEEYDFHVRWPAVKLLTSLLANKPKDLQEIVLVSPMGVSKLMDLLSDSREVIRNDALLLLTQLTKGNANIQKIVAFENAFDRLFDVIMEEGYSDGGIVVEDCLLLMLNLLRNNTSNQNFFKEGSYIQRLTPMFKLPQDVDDSGWSAQKVSNIHCMLQGEDLVFRVIAVSGILDSDPCPRQASPGSLEKMIRLFSHSIATKLSPRWSMTSRSSHCPYSISAVGPLNQCHCLCRYPH